MDDDDDDEYVWCRQICYASVEPWVNTGREKAVATKPTKSYTMKWN